MKVFFIPVGVLSLYISHEMYTVGEKVSLFWPPSTFKHSYLFDISSLCHLSLGQNLYQQGATLSVLCSFNQLIKACLWLQTCHRFSCSLQVSLLLCFSPQKPNRRVTAVVWVISCVAHYRQWTGVYFGTASKCTSQCRAVVAHLSLYFLFSHLISVLMHFSQCICVVNANCWQSISNSCSETINRVNLPSLNTSWFLDKS